MTTINLEPSDPKKPTVVPLEGKGRLQALEDLDVLDTPLQRNFEMLVDLANKFLGTPVSLISLVTPERQFFLSASGLGEPWASCRETPLTHSFCQHVVKRNEPLVVIDAEIHELVKDNKAIDDLGVKAYLGLPIVMPDGNVIGSFCAIDDKPREWTHDDLETIEKLVELTVIELSNKKANRKRQEILENRLSQAQKIQALGQLVGGVSHDFNNVLGAIQIQSELLKAKLKNDQSTPVDHILNTVHSAKLIVQQLLDWSRPSTGEKVISSLNQIVEDTLPLISTYSTRFIEICFEPVECADTVKVDPSKVGQILLNLCSNAAYAMKSKGGKITIEISSEEVAGEWAEEMDLKPGPYVKLHVSDDGCGIPHEFHQRIHDPYFTTKPVGEGTGLGLWTVYGIVRDHGGQIHLESAENEGTTIEIYLPLHQQDQNEIATPRIDRAAKEGQIRVLVVDDESVIVDGMVALLNISGFSARGFTNGLEALKVFVESPESFDIVISDQVMPHISGEELIREIKAIRSGIPVIMCSGYSETFQQKDIHKRHADAYCQKPNRFSDLVQLIESLCG